MYVYKCSHFYLLPLLHAFLVAVLEEYNSKKLIY